MPRSADGAPRLIVARAVSAVHCPPPNPMSQSVSRAVDKAQSQMILIAVLVCLFSIGMAGLLNYFKYRTTADRLIKERLVVVGQGIENSIRSSLALGLQFSDLGTLPEMLERERSTDLLIRSIEIFDTEGKLLYGTDRLRALRGAPKKWVDEAQDAAGDQWMVKDGADSAVGIPVKNNFGLVIGHLALRFDDSQLAAVTAGVAREIAGIALVVFLVSAAVATLALVTVLDRMSTDLAAVEQALHQAVTPSESTKLPTRGPFARPLMRFFDTVRAAESQIAMLRARLGRGGS